MNKIKLFDPNTDMHDEKAVLKVLKSHFWASGAGTGNVKKFENSLKKYVESKDCLAVNSGTAALHLALNLADVSGKEVILPSLSFVSTAHAIALNGGKPVFVDVDQHTLCMDPEKIVKAITKKTKVILPVHFGGMPADLHVIKGICKTNNLLLIEDAAHAIGSKYKNKKIGSHGFAVCFSFHPVKNLAIPTGGAIALNGNQIKNKRKLIESKRWCGISDRKNVKYDVSQLGWNYYMNEFSAALGLSQLKKLDRLNRKRKQFAKMYSKNLSLENKMPYNNDCSYHFFWIRVKNRNNFMKKMKDKGIETGIHYYPIHKMSYYNEKIKLPITDKVSQEIVSIPIHPNLSYKDFDYIVKTINSISN